MVAHRLFDNARYIIKYLYSLLKNEAVHDFILDWTFYYIFLIVIYFIPVRINEGENFITKDKLLVIIIFHKLFNKS